MFVRIETSSGIPITRQIMDQIRAQCASGILSPGERLPSIRELARDLAVNQNTILRAYERLTASGLLERRHGNGTYVTTEEQPQQQREQREQLRKEIENVTHHAVTLGYGPEQIHLMVDQALQHLKQSSEREKGASNE